MKESNKNSVTELINFTADKVIEMSKTSSVLNSTVSSVDGSTVITVSDLSIGFAGGGTEKNSKKTSDNPSGAGGKISVKPKAVIIVDNGSIKLKNLNDGKTSTISSGVQIAKKLFGKKN